MSTTTNPHARCRTNHLGPSVYRNNPDGTSTWIAAVEHYRLDDTLPRDRQEKLDVHVVLHVSTGPEDGEEGDDLGTLEVVLDDRDWIDLAKVALAPLGRR